MVFFRTVLMTAVTASVVAGSGWGPAQEVPGTAALAGPGGQAQVSSVSCASPGNCVAGGYYAVPKTPTASAFQGFLVSQVNGKWGTAQPVPGLAALNVGHNARISVVSCSSPGNCSAGGYYATTPAEFSVMTTAFVVSEVSGTWGQAEPVPGLAALNTGDQASILSLSCASAGDCTAGGSYRASPGQQGFVVSEVHGTWGQVQQVPGLVALNKEHFATVSSVSCTGSGDCAAGGSYLDLHGVSQGYVAEQNNGRWGRARDVPGLSALHKGPETTDGATTDAVACASPGNCAAGGGYGELSHAEAFIDSERNGTWGQAAQVRGAAALKPDGQANVEAVSCGSPGNCAAAGQAYQVVTSGDDMFTYLTVFVVSEVKGTWGIARRVPGIARLNRGNSARFYSLDCPSAGNCVAGGFYADASGQEQAMLVSEVNGKWSAPQPIAGLAALSGTGGGSGIYAVSCAAAGKCSAGGFYLPHGSLGLALVASRG